MNWIGIWMGILPGILMAIAPAAAADPRGAPCLRRTSTEEQPDELAALAGPASVDGLVAVAHEYRRRGRLPGRSSSESAASARLLLVEAFVRRYSTTTRPWVRMHADVADVGNRVRDAEARSKSASASASADFRKFQDKMIAAMDAQKARVESVERAIDGLHRALQAALDERKSDDKKTRAVRAATRDGDANPPHNPRALLAREHELAVVLPEIRRGDKEPEARRARSSSRSKSRERGGSPPSPPGDETRL